MYYIITIQGGSNALEPWEDKWGDGDGGVVVKCHQHQPDTDGSVASADQGFNSLGVRYLFLLQF